MIDKEILPANGGKGDRPPMPGAVPEKGIAGKLEAVRESARSWFNRNGIAPV